MEPAKVVSITPPTFSQEIIALTLWLLSARMYQFLTLALCAAAFGFTLWAPTPARIVTAVLFTLLTHVWTYWPKAQAKGTP